MAIVRFVRVQGSYRTLDYGHSSLGRDIDEVLVDPEERCLPPDLLLHSLHGESVGSLEVFIPVPKRTVHFGTFTSRQHRHFGTSGISREVGLTLAVKLVEPESTEAWGAGVESFRSRGSCIAQGKS